MPSRLHEAREQIGIRDPLCRGEADFRDAGVLRYFGKRVNRSGEIPARFQQKLQANYKEYREGERVKYWLDSKLDKVLRQGLQRGG